MSNMDRPGGSATSGGTATDFADRPTGTVPPQDAQDVKQQAGEAVGTAADEGKHLTNVAGEEARNVAGEAKQQGRALLDDARSQLEDQSRTQKDRLAQTLGSVGDDLERMSGQADSGLASDLVRQAAERVRSVSSHLEGREPAELLGEVRDFARRRPGTFLLGAVAAGVVAGRFARGAQKAQQGSHSTTSPSSGVPSSTTSMGATSTGPTSAGVPVTGEETVALPSTPSAPAMATFPPDRPGQI